MGWVVSYLLSFLAGLTTLFACNALHVLPSWVDALGTCFNTALMGALAGCVYCLRAVYVNHCVKDQWNSRWMVWYFVRPITSCAIGGVSTLFLKAGLLALNSEPSSAASADTIPY